MSEGNEYSYLLFAQHSFMRLPKHKLVSGKQNLSLHFRALKARDFIMSQHPPENYFRFCYTSERKVETQISSLSTRSTETLLQFSGFEVRAVEDCNMTQHLLETSF